MKCEKIQDLFSGYMEDTMDTATKTKFEQHLAQCASCSAAYDRFNAAVMMLDELPEVEPPAGLHAAVMARLETSRRTAARPVKWWSIDWQHVFTIRVPARGAAMAFAVLLLFALLVQLTPVGNVAANLFGIQKHEQTVTGEYNDENSVPPWKPWSPTAVGDTGLTVRASHGVGGYSLNVGTTSSKAVAFTVDASGKNYAGFVVKNQSSGVWVPVSHSSGAVVATVSWEYKDVARTERIFLPTTFDPKSAGRTVTRAFENHSVSQILQWVSEEYGVVIHATGDLGKQVPYFAVTDGNPSVALDGLSQAGVDRRALATSEYAVQVAP